LIVKTVTLVIYSDGLKDWYQNGKRIKSKGG